MHIDLATLEHLDVFGSSHQTRTVFVLLDRTLSEQGRRALRRRLAEPPASLVEVLDLQVAHREVRSALDAYRVALNGASLDAVGHYLASTWLLPSRMPTVRRFKAWFRRYRADAAEGLDACRALIRAAASVADLAAASTSARLASHARVVHEKLADPNIQTLMAQQGSATRSVGVLQANDELARGVAKAALTDLGDCLADLDALQSIASAATLDGWTFPSFGDRLSLRGVVHPLVDGPVSNDLVAGEQACLFFVTGPNMAGKSTFVKAVGIAILLAHVGAAVPARAMETPFFDAIFSTAHVRDDVQRGESLFLAETRRMAALARTIAGNDRTFAILDEPFRGTNVHDATEATLAVLQRLIARGRDTVFVASHLAEIAPPLGTDPRVALLAFEADCSTGTPMFAHRIREGFSSQRLGMHLLEREGVLALLDAATRRPAD